LTATCQFNGLQPLTARGDLSINIGHELPDNTNWNYYQYGAGSFVGPAAPRYFHANSLTESLPSRILISRAAAFVEFVKA
jgi:hypothetical protein